MRTLRISIAQINPTVGDLAGNRDRIIDYIGRARRLSAELVVFPELAVTGYPPEDLVLKPQFVKDNLRALGELAKETRGLAAVVGFVAFDGRLRNAAAVMNDGKLVHVYHKMLLPNYGVFDECRYFYPGERYSIVKLKGVKIGINICEDIWFADGPARVLAAAGAEVIVAINASPYHKGKGEERRRMLASRAKENGVHVVYANAVGGQDELVFDGHSMILDPRGGLPAAGGQFAEELMTYDLRMPGPTRRRAALTSNPLPDRLREAVDYVVLTEGPASRKRRLPPARKTKPYALHEEVYRALVLGTRDYVNKNGFQSVVIGLSGGVDSSLVAATAVAAVGKENVHGVFMPSEFSSEESREDAAALADNLGIDLLTIPIHLPFHACLDALRGAFAGAKRNVAEENLQARIRGNILMALSNKFGWLVLTTGNKSELSTGYATLYGDMAGGFAVIKDVPKTLVYAVCRRINRLSGKNVIPKRVLVKAPTAELRPNQKDSDSLPEYPALDPILKAYVEDDLELDEMLMLGFDRRTVERVIRLVDASEYKRRQAPPGVKITPRGLGKDRRFPITNRYKSY
jgi:NAD+ synthase (glutamine-hydrolysing)